MQKHPIVLALIVGLMSCASPAGVPGVPPGARGHWEVYKDYRTYRWERRLESGCASWVVIDGDAEQGAEVSLSVDRANCRDGRGVAYNTYMDHLVFRNYWQRTHDRWWTSENGEITGYAPCPHALPEGEISHMRAVAQEANARATTDAERRTLTRVDELLSRTNGAALASGHEGCTDLPLTLGAGVDRRQDTWNGTSRPMPPARGG